MTFGPRNCKRLLGAKSPFSQQNLQRDVLDRDEETARIQYLTEIAKKFTFRLVSVIVFVLIEFYLISAEGRKSHKQSSDKGHESYEDRTEMLHLIARSFRARGKTF
ncbi:hypothetical protein HN873_005666 [Arachis hypogaea]